MTCREARSGDEVARVRDLFIEYSRRLGIDLSFQDFDRELAELPGAYVRPDGRLLLAEIDGDPAGCVGLRRLDAETGEMKRLYVRPRFRGRRVGHALASAIVEAARGVGYARMRLDTLPSMSEAIALYEVLGFRRIPPYRDNPVEGAIFMELQLR